MILLGEQVVQQQQTASVPLQLSGNSAIALLKKDAAGTYNLGGVMLIKLLMYLVVQWLHEQFLKVQQAQETILCGQLLVK